MRHQIPTTVWRDAYRDPALGKAFDRELRAEAMRRTIHERDETPGREPFVPVPAEELLARARMSLTKRALFDETPEGRFVAAVRDMTELATRLTMIAGQARAARDRSFAGSLPRLDALSRQADALIRDLKLKAQDAQLAVDDAYHSEAA